MDLDSISDIKERIGKIIEVLKNDLATIRTGRATPSLVENIVISAYQGSAKLKVMELATIGATDTATLVITPFDHTTINEIEKGIREANIGLSPVVDGQIVRISLPPLSTERREELIKSVKHKLENGKIMVRQARHEAMTEVKKQKEDNAISEDDVTRLEKEIQKIVDTTSEQIDEMGKQKEAELLQL